MPEANDHLSDEQLMRRIQSRDAVAFRELYRRYQRRLGNYFWRMTGGDAPAAQDLLQELFIKIVEKPGRYDSARSFKTWVFSVAYNQCKNYYRHRQSRGRIDHDPDPDRFAVDPTDDAHEIERRTDHSLFLNALYGELHTMDEVQKSAFLLRFQQQFSIKEISAIQGCSEGTVKSRLFYTAKRLAEKLGAFNPHVSEDSK